MKTSRRTCKPSQISDYHSTRDRSIILYAERLVLRKLSRRSPRVSNYYLACSVLWRNQFYLQDTHHAWNHSFEIATRSITFRLTKIRRRASQELQNNSTLFKFSAFQYLDILLYVYRRTEGVQALNLSFIHQSFEYKLLNIFSHYIGSHGLDEGLEARGYV